MKKIAITLLASMMLATPIATYTTVNNAAKVEAISRPRRQYLPKRFWGKWHDHYRTIKINRYGLFD